MGGSNGGSEGEELGWYILNIGKGFGGYVGGGPLEEAKSAQNVKHRLLLAVSLQRQ